MAKKIISFVLELIIISLICQLNIFAWVTVQEKIKKEQKPPIIPASIKNVNDLPPLTELDILAI